jgi:hypothetical protein
MMMNKRIVHIILLVLILVSCQREKIIDLEVPQKRKLIAVVYIGAGNSSVVSTVTHSAPVIGSPEPESFDPEIVPNANGVFSDVASSDAWPFVFDDNMQQYSATMSSASIQAGRQYRVQFSDEYETVEGTTTIPMPVATSLSIKLDSTVSQAFRQFTVTITCTSLSEGTNNIRLVPFLIFNDTMPYSMTDIYDQQYVMQLTKGGSFTQDFTAPYSNEFFSPTRVDVMVLSCDDAYMKYFNSTGFSYDQFGPLSDPSMVYSNMSNKIGVIASYNVSETQSFPIH